jgi:hypothetical protein
VSRVSGLVDRVLASPARSTRHRLHAVRFGRLIGSLRHLVELGDDASEKLRGEWILDRSYVASFAGRTLDRAREIVFDSAVLTGDASAALHGRLDAVRANLDRLMAEGPSGFAEGPTVVPRESGAGGARLEEPEYRLLHAAIQSLALTADTTSGPGSSPTAPRLAGLVQEAHERALQSFEGLHLRSWGRLAGLSLTGSGFPVPVRIVDSGGGVIPAHREWGSRVGWERVGSEPLRALLGPLAGSDRGSSSSLPGPGPRALAVLGEGRSTVSVNWKAGGLLIDARLEDHAPANLVYCALRGEPPGRAEGLEAVLDESGFRRLQLGPGLTGWMTGRTPGDTRDVLGRIGECLEGLLPGPRGASRARPLGPARSGEWRA